MPTVDVAAILMQDRLARMSEVDRTTLYTFMGQGDNERRVLIYALGATNVQLQRLRELLEAELRDRQGEGA